MNRLTKTIAVIMIVSAVSLMGWTGWKYWTGRNTASVDTKTVTDQLSQLMILPDGTPTVATVVDAAKLKLKDPFYKRAENGDKVVIWKERAVIYRPSARKIVDFGIVVQ